MTYDTCAIINNFEYEINLIDDMKKSLYKKLYVTITGHLIQSKEQSERINRETYKWWPDKQLRRI